MATPVYKVQAHAPAGFPVAHDVFLILAVLLAVILDGQTQQLRHSFMANPGLNTLIIGVLIVGTVYAFRQVLRLYPEINWVNNFRISDPGISSEKTHPRAAGAHGHHAARPHRHRSLATGSMRSLWTRSPPASMSSARRPAISSASWSFSACSARSGACCKR